MSIYNDELVINAKKFAFERHEGQMYDEEQNLTMGYFLEALASRVVQWGYAQPPIVAACYLSSLMSECGVEYEELVERFDHVAASIAEDLYCEGPIRRPEEMIYKTSPKIRMNLSSTIVSMASWHVAMGHGLKKSKNFRKSLVILYPIWKASLYDPWRLKNEWKELDQMYETLKESLL